MSNQKTIDTHLHLDESVSGGADKAVALLCEQMDEAGVERGVVLHLEAQRWSLEEVASAIHAEKRLLCFANVNPMDPEAADKLRWAITDLGCAGLKLHPRLQDYQVNHNRTVALVRQAGELGAPTLIDAFPDGDWLLQGHTILDYAHLARACENTKLIIAHMAGHKVLDAMMIAKRTPNIYFDTSYSLLYYRGSSIPADMVYAMRSMRFKRIFYGSDYPDRGMKETVDDSIRVMREHNVGETELDAILYQNALEFMPWQAN